jgi:hypothetical protein
MRKIFTFLCIIGATTASMAQWGDEEMDDSYSWRERIFTGGGFGLGFSRYQDFVSISPIVGYRINQKLAAGVGFQYQYSKYKLSNPDVSTNNYGGSIFSRYNVYGPIFLHAEYEYLNYEFVISSTESDRRDYNSVFGGAGFFQPFGRHVGMFITVLYNFTYDSNDIFPYDSPWVIRAGIPAGF